jgi:hypothetical protein
MSKVERLENGIKFTCDCGLIHDITMNENSEFIINSIYNKKGCRKWEDRNRKYKTTEQNQEQNQEQNHRPEGTEGRNKTSFFDIF